MKKILVVDDNKDFNDVVKEILELENYIVEQSFDGKDAFKKVIKNKYDLVLMDLKMPLMTGWECIEAIYQADPSIPIFVISGNIRDEDIENFKNKNVYKLYDKPINLEKLRKDIKLFFEKKI